ncbi:MAG: DNA polymerase III subunit delta' [Marinobacterium sp.]|nr:DNA polymerase III subunit delta' [Marinobacterium sp.]
MGELHISSCPWLGERWNYLIRLYNQARLPHALLINGPEGVGKAVFARAFSTYLLCQQRADGRACGYCKNCQLSQSDGGHPDLYVLEPEERGKPVRVDQVRELTNFVYSTAQQGGYRLVIIGPAHDMNVAASNALLKTLEEPGQETILLLLTHRLGQVMPTIRSRCQRVDIASPSLEVSVPWVAQKLQIEEEKSRQYLVSANSAPLAALAFEDGELGVLRQQLISGLADLLKRRRTLVEVSSAWQKLDLERMLGWLHGLLGDLARLQIGQGDQYLRHRDAENMLKALARRVSTESLFAYIDQVAETRRALLARTNPNKQLLIESLLLGWLGLARG